MAGEHRIKILRKSPRRRSGPVLFSIMRDESYHLPHFLAHYRALGLRDFLIYDDSSSDGTRELLLAEDDVTVITSDTPFGAKVRGAQRWATVLKETVPGAFVKTGWALLADADEYLLLPGGFGDIRELVRFLDAQGAVCAAASLVDFYPAQLADRAHARDLPPLGAKRYFDKTALFDWPAGALSPSQHEAGLRARLRDRLAQEHAAEYRRLFGEAGAALALTWKVPLLRCDSGARVWNQHDGNVAPPAALRLAFAHCKFTPDLDAKISHALTSRAYFDSSAEYVFLDAVLRHYENLPLVGPESVEFENAASLESAGHMFAR